MGSRRSGVAANVISLGCEDSRQFQALAETAPLMIWRSGVDKRCDYFNRRWCAFTGRALEQELGLGWTRGLRVDDYQRCVETFNASHAARLPFTMDYHLRRHDGVYRWVLSTGVPYYLGGAFAGFLGSCIDISGHQDAADRDTSRAGGRDTEMRELNHRLKNSLQTSICFSAQGRPLRDEKTQADLCSLTERLSLLALVHEQLHCFAGDPDRAFCGYIEALAQSVHAAIGRTSVKLHVQCEPVLLGPKRAAAIGAIVDELLTTALTKRFPENRSGTVRLDSRPAADRRIEVSIADDGLVDALHEQPSYASFQRQLVERLVAHANGTIRYELDGGTRCVITLDPE